MKYWIAVLTVIAIATVASATAIDTMWVRTFDGFGYGNIQLTAMKLDRDGNPIVTGTIGTAANGSDFVTLKYLPNGDTAWMRTYDSPEHGLDRATGLAVERDAIGVAGLGVGSFFLTALWYDLQGNELAPPLRIDVTFLAASDPAIVFDHQLNTYLSLGINFGSTMFVRTGPNFGTIWTRQIANLLDAAPVVEGNDILLCGRRAIGLGEAYATVKISPAGDSTWVSEDSCLTGSTQPTSTSVDDSGYVYVSGWRSPHGWMDLRPWVTIKYGSSGEPIWKRSFDRVARNNYNVRTPVMAQNGAQGIYLAGDAWRHYSQQNQILDDSSEYGVVKYLSNGDTAWTRAFHLPGICGHKLSSIAVDSAGNVYLTGMVNEDCNGLDYDVVTIKYTAAGVLEWVAKYASANAGGDVPVAIAIDQSGHVYVAGYTVDRQFFLIKYDQGEATDVTDDDDVNLPVAASLTQNYPNPFNPSTQIEFSLPRPEQVEITIVNVLGQKVRVLLSSTLPAGSHVISWDGTDDSGRSVSSGVYFYTLRASGRIETRKMLLLK